MTSVAPTPLLMLILLFATVLGAGIGACLWHWRVAHRFDKTLEAVRRKAAAQRQAMDTILSGERKRGTLKQVAAHDALAKAQAESRRLQEQHDSLLRHAQAQGRRINALEAEVLKFEGEGSGARDPHVVRHVASEQAKRFATPLSSAGGRPEPVLSHQSSSVGCDLDLPVLNRRVVKQGLNAQSQASALDVDIPVLSESELPQDADALARDLIDKGDLFPSRDD